MICFYLAQVDTTKEQKENNIMKNLTDTLTTLISEITQMEKDNAKLNEDIRAIEKEKAEGYKKFDTDTHILVERKTLQDIADATDDVFDSANSARDDMERAEGYINDANYSARDARDSANDIENDIKQILKVEEEEETE